MQKAIFCLLFFFLPIKFFFIFLSAILECIPGQAQMKQSVYKFKEILTPYCYNYSSVKSMYDFHVYLDGNKQPMVENARFELSETLLCGSRQKADSFISKIFKQVPPLDLQFQLVMPKMEGIIKMVPNITKWEKVITDTAKTQLLNLQEEIHSHAGTPFLTLLNTIQDKRVPLERCHETEAETDHRTNSRPTNESPQSETTEEQPQVNDATTATNDKENVAKNLKKSSRLSRATDSNAKVVKTRKRKLVQSSNLSTSTTPNLSSPTPASSFVSASPSTISLPPLSLQETPQARPRRTRQQRHQLP